MQPNVEPNNPIDPSLTTESYISPETFSPDKKKALTKEDKPLSHIIMASQVVDHTPESLTTHKVSAGPIPTDIPISYTNNEMAEPSSSASSTTSYIHNDELIDITSAADPHKSHKEALIALIGKKRIVDPDLPVSVRDPATGEEMVAKLSDLHVSPLLVNPQYEGDTKHFEAVKDTLRVYESSGVDNAVSNLEVLGSGQYKVALRMNALMQKKSGELTLKPLVLATGISTHKPEDALLDAQKNEIKMVLANVKQKIPGVVPNYGVLQAPLTEEFVLISKFCNRGSLKDAIPTLFQSADTDKVSIIKQCWEPIAHFHQAGLSHRDIKMSNFMMHENAKKESKIYLGDLGLASPSTADEDEVKKLNSNLNLLPPFVFKDQKKMLADPKLDNWAFGLMICNMLRSPHPDLAFDADTKIVGKLSPVMPWLRFCMLSKNPMYAHEASGQIAQFIEETFDKAPISTNPNVNQAFKQLVMDLMQIDLQNIPDDAQISQRLAQIQQLV